MAINFKLVDRTPDDPETSPWGRTWIGWDPEEPAEAVWAVNRGVWTLGERAEKERIATLSYDGTVRVVAEIAGRELIRYHHGTKARYAVEGNVLPPGNPVREALIGREVDHHRNPVTYFDTSQVEQSAVPRAVAARRSWLGLDGSQRAEAVRVTARGGQYPTTLALPHSTGADLLTVGDHVFILDVEADPWRLAATAVVTTRPPAASEGANIGVPIALVAILNEGDELPLKEPDILTPLTRGFDSSGSEIGPAAAHALDDQWQRHLENVGWWGGLSEVQAAVKRYSAEFTADTEPAPVRVRSGVRANSQAAFDALASCYGGPTSLTMAEAYLKLTELTPEVYSISALPSTQASNAQRRAFTISVGLIEVFFVELEPSSGQVKSWTARVSGEQTGPLARWLDLVLENRSSGSFVQGQDPRGFFRSLSDEDDQKAIRAGAQDLVVGGKGHRRDDWHNPFLDAAVQQASPAEG